MRPLALVVPLLLASALAPAASAHHPPDPSAPWDFRNAQPTAFGQAELPPYLDLPAGEPVEVAVPLTLHPDRLTRPAFRYLVGLNLHDDAVQVESLTLTRDGKAVPVERDERDRALQPRFIVAGADLPREGPVELVLTATLAAAQDGRLHVGALAIAFDAGWGTLRTDDGAPAQVYAFTLAMSDGHAAQGLAPRFTGQGNSPWALAPLALLALPSAAGLRAAWRTLHPPAPKPVARGEAAAAPPTPVAVPVARPSGPVTAPATWGPARPASPARPAQAHAAPPPLARPAQPTRSPAELPLAEFTWSEPYIARTHTAVRRPKRPAPAGPAVATVTTTVVARPATPFKFEVLQPARRR